MMIPDRQEVAMFWNGRAIGKVWSRIAEPYEGVYTVVWSGEVLGQPVRAGSLAGVQRKMYAVADGRGLERCWFDAGYGVDVLFDPQVERAEDGPVEGLDVEIDVDKVVRELRAERGL